MQLLEREHRRLVVNKFTHEQVFKIVGAVFAFELFNVEQRAFVDNGSIASTLATSLSFEKRYTLNVIVTDFTGDFDLLIVPVLAWLRENQPDIMTTDAGQKKGFTFYADINNDSSFDISISLMLTERTLVSEVDGALHVKNIPEPPPPEPVTRPMELYINGELVSKWDE